jgi:hypothetical protein
MMVQVGGRYEFSRYCISRISIDTIGLQVSYGGKPFSIIKGPKVRAKWIGPAFAI